MTTGALIARLVAVVGPAHLLTDRADVAMRDHDGRGPAGRALALVRPGCTAEIARVMAIAADEGVRVVPQGARTGLVAGGAADDSGSMLLLSLERLTSPLAIDPVNRTARVGAGVTLSQLNAAAAEHGLFFPIDLGADPSVGGMIAANTGGARFLRYGDVRRNLLSIELVSGGADGEVRTLGRDCWKQNDGMDLKQLAIGTGGAMGIVTAATLTLQPRPAHAVTALLALTDAMAIDRLLVAFEHDWGMMLTAFEGMSPAAYEAALRHVPRLRRPFAADAGHRYFLLVELAAGAAFDGAMLEEALGTAIAPFMEGDAALVADVAVDRHDGLWALRHAIPEGLRASGSVIGCDVALRRGDVAAFRAAMTAEVLRDHPDLRVCDFGHVGDGGLHFNMLWPHEAGPIPPGLADALRMQVSATVVERHGGSFSAEHGVGPRNVAAYRRFTPSAVQRLAGHVQSLFASVPIGRVAFGPAAEEETCPTN
ncbi:FAD-binding oxidoreductase [Sphingomonas sp. C8-2]|jgi:FAD/FMN-containing dehydrogenase|nr:FAD-binding oxidoreductase [Sphingomonas sp. C8-2]